MITLYHGSNMAFSVPDLSVGRQGMDFGKGFYLTPNSGTAQKMAERVTRIRGFGAPIVIVFAFDDMAARQANMVLDFNVMDRKWVEFIIANRTGDESAAEHNLDARHPIVHGYVADDRLMQIIDDYENGDLTIAEVERRLANAPFRAFQYSFHTPEALAMLTFKGVLQ